MSLIGVTVMKFVPIVEDSLPPGIISLRLELKEKTGRDLLPILRECAGNDSFNQSKCDDCRHEKLCTKLYYQLVDREYKFEAVGYVD